MRPVPRGLLLVLSSFVAVLAGSIGLALGTALPAGAHAVVVSSIPAADERLSAPPAEVSFTFSEAVTSDLGGITVLAAPSGDRVDNDDTTQPSATSIRATVQPGLADGTYTAQYKVISADGHPVSGAIVFGIGDAQLGDVSGLAAATDTTTERLGTVGRFLTYAAALLAAGLAFFLLFLHDGAADRRRLASIVQVATLVAAVGAALTIAVQASLATGDGLGAVAQVEVLRGVLREGLGWSTAVLFVGLALCHVAVRTRPSMLAQGLGFYGSLAVTASFVLWGHAVEAPNRWLAMGADVVHVAVAAAWFGGLVGLTLTLRTRIRDARAAGLPEPTLAASARPASPPLTSLSAAVLDPTLDDQPAGDRPEPGSLGATVAIVRRFSTMAAVTVVLLALSGVVLGWQELGSFGALTSSDYGQTLLVKLALVGAVLVLAGYNRFLLLPWLLADDPATTGDGGAPAAADDRGEDGSSTAPVEQPDHDAATTDGVDRAEIDRGLEAGWRTLLRTVAAEAVVLVAVLAVTAVLVNVVPGRTDSGPAGPFAEQRPFREGTVALTVTPNQPGSNSFHVDFFGPDGRPADLAQKVNIELRLPEKGLGPFETDPLLKGGTGHFFLEGVTDLSLAGTWEITLNVRVSDFDQERVTFTDTIG
jgi:copper transport protein